MFADDVKLNAEEPMRLERLLTLSEQWSKRTRMMWSTQKCVVLTPRDQNPPFTFRLAGEAIQTAESTQYLGYSITSTRVTAVGSIRSLKRARERLCQLREAGTKANVRNAETLLVLCDTFFHQMPHMDCI